MQMRVIEGIAACLFSTWSITSTWSSSQQLACYDGRFTAARRRTCCFRPAMIVALGTR